VNKLFPLLLLLFSAFGFANNSDEHNLASKPELIKKLAEEGLKIDETKYTVFLKGLVRGEKIALINVNGMVCDFCARGIEKTFMKSGNVKKVDVDLDAGKVLIAYALGAKINFREIKEKITANGQTAINMKIIEL